MIHFAANAAAKTANAFEWPEQLPKIDLPVGYLHRNLTYSFFGPPVFTKNGFSIGSAVFSLHSSPQSVPLLHNGPLRIPSKLPLPWGSGPPFNTWYRGPIDVIIPNSISIGSAVFVWIPNVMLYHTLSISFFKKTKNCPFTLRFCHPDEVGPSHGDRQHAQKMHMWFGRYARGQTETHTLQYFTTTSMGKVISNNDQH